MRRSTAVATSICHSISLALVEASFPSVFLLGGGGGLECRLDELLDDGRVGERARISEHLDVDLLPVGGNLA